MFKGKSTAVIVWKQKTTTIRNPSSITLYIISKNMLKNSIQNLGI